MDIRNQEDRHAQLKIGQRPPIPIIIPLIKPLPVEEKDVRALKEKVYSQYTLPAKEVERIIEQKGVS